jgi:hypothetical protein
MNCFAFYPSTSSFFNGSEMLVSYSKNFLFLRVPKTGGTSINEALLPYRNPQERKFYARIVRRLPIVPTPSQFLAFDAHTHWCMLKAKRALPQDIFNSLFKFAFVRHPVEWQISVYKHILHYEYLADFAVEFAGVYKHRSFEDYIRWRIDHGPIPQVTQMIDQEGRFLLDYVGRFENLDHDFRQVCAAVNIPPPTLERLNQSPDDHSIVIDSQVVKLIYDAYQVDFETFGYGERSVVADWMLSQGLSFPEVAVTLQRAGGENFDPWKSNILW